MKHLSKDVSSVATSAMAKYKALMCTLDPFPNAKSEAELADCAWAETREVLGLDAMVITKEIRISVKKMFNSALWVYNIQFTIQILQGTSNIRGAIWDCVRACTAEYGFQQASEADVERVNANVKLYKLLTTRYNYIFVYQPNVCSPFKFTFCLCTDDVLLQFGGHYTYYSR